MKEIYLIVDNEGKYRQGLYYQGIDLEKFENKIKKMNYKLKIKNYDEILNQIGINEIRNKIIFYTSSQKSEYKKYLDDILFELSKENQLIPNYEIFKCHENKSYQEIYKKRIGLHSLNSYSFACLNDLRKYKQKLNFPIVLKTLSGAGSIGVSLENNYIDLEKKVKKMNKPVNMLEFQVKKYLKKNILKKYYFETYYKEDFYIGNYILQDFVPNLKEDWKVLIFGDKYYILNRKIRENDFRASGSGKLSYIEPPIEVLEYAKKCFEKLNVPFISLDICIDNNNECYLIEYQGLHFGPYTLINSEWYYEFINDIFVKKICKSDLAEEYAEAYIKYLEKK